MSLIPSSLSVILVEPQHPGNIGMVCRAMANFGLHDLRLVNPCPHLHPEAAKFAVFAKPLLGKAQLFDDLPSALADLSVTCATTRRLGRLRGPLLDIAALPPLLPPLDGAERVGIVFGREDAGLTTDEVALCRHAVTIPTTAQDGSLNLAQAVLLSLYELCRPERPAAPAANVETSIELPPQAEFDGLFAQMEEVLDRIAFLNPSKPQGAMNALRQLVHRSSPDRREIALLRGVWAQLASSINDWRGRRRGN